MMQLILVVYTLSRL